MASNAYNYNTLLEVVADMAVGVIPIGVRFLVRIEDVSWVKDVLDLFKQSQYLRAELCFQPRAAY